MNSTRACIFDAYGTLLDVHSAVMANADKVGDGAEAFSALWRQRQLEYSWTRGMMGKYADFWQLTIEALDFVLQAYGLEGRPGLKENLLNAYFELKAYPDAAKSLEMLKAQGYVTAILSNGSNDMLQGAIRAGNLGGLLDDCISADDIKTYKPDPSVYQLACDRLDVRPHQVCFVSSNSWDVAGAAAFGFNAVRINRNDAPLEYHCAPMKHQLKALAELPMLLSQARA
ncbi:haloacid dehalogenase type II [Pollutimonas sp. M17]|uniref:haloacid dehalogenase type II n=1 Tax=Pollutimonas sp. M17 TaxID=2962065 RepID=UPI0021F4736A|nr:haloacid dehalogenase type II [Pollutimonas sp. M17]UYO93082.1 haloacid dehalogenase type II [Pollutimonas sp. M17]